MYASHTTLSNIFSSPYEAPIVFPVHRCMLCNACIPIHHYSSSQEAVRESTHRVEGVRQCYFVSSGHYVNGTANPRSIHVGLKWAISSQCPQYSHFTRCMYSAIRMKRPFMPRSMHVGLQQTIHSQCPRYSHCTGCMYSAILSNESHLKA